MPEAAVVSPPARRVGKRRKVSPVAPPVASLDEQILRWLRLNQPGGLAESELLERLGCDQDEFRATATSMIHRGEIRLQRVASRTVPVILLADPG
jgi:hypothetical protein